MEDVEIKQIMDEIQAFVRQPQKITLPSGEVIEVQPLTWKQELMILKIIGELFETKLSSIFSAGQSVNAGLFIGQLLQSAPDSLTEIVSIITRKSKEEIEEKYILEDVAEIAFPFLEKFLKRLKLIGQQKLMPVLQNITQALTLK